MEVSKPTPAQRALILGALDPHRPEGQERVINTWRTPEKTTHIMQRQGWIKLELRITDAAEIRKLQDEVVRLVTEARDKLNESIDNWPAARVALGQVKDISDQLSARVYRVTPEGEKAVGWIPSEAATSVK